MHPQFARTALAAALIAGLAALAPAGGASAYTYKVIHDFCSKRNCGDGADPQAPVTVGPDGALVGTTADGQFGSGIGTVFRLSFAQLHDKWRYQRLHTFCKNGCSDGAGPLAPLIIDTAGNLYGTTQTGGSSCGTIFEVSAPIRGHKPQFTVLYTFAAGSNCPGGGQVRNRLAYAGQSSGLLYDGTSPLFSTSASGGVGNAGNVFMLTPGTPWTYTALYNFCSQARCADGQDPSAGVTLDANGNIFGVTGIGGIKNGGTAFELQSPGWTYKKLYDFCQDTRRCADGTGPGGELVFDAAGNLFGTTTRGGAAHKGCCGTIYKLTPQGTGWSESVLYNFCSRPNCLDGEIPTGPLVMDASGALIGTTFLGGGNNSGESLNGAGTVYRFDGTALQTLYSFCALPQCTDGALVSGGVSADQAGNLFGTTIAGGKIDEGAVFELSP